MHGFVSRCSFLLLLMLSACWQLSAQSDNIVTPQAITAPLQQSNIGKILFTAKSIPVADLKEADVLTSYELTNKSNLFITVFMGNSLTNYLHKTAPTLTVDELTSSGNYQFSLYVDDRLIYSSNLHPGAPYATIKNTETVLSKPLINNENPGGLWSQSYWSRFLINGGDSALTEGKHLLKMEIRPYIQQPNITLETGGLIATGQLELLVKRKPVIDLSAVHLSAVKAYNGLPVSTAAFDRDKIKALKGNIEEGVFKSITSIIIIKNGALLLEEYFNGAGRDSLHDVRSVGKSFASTLTGIAQNDGYLKNEAQPLSAFYSLSSYANNAPEKSAVSIKDLLTMSAVFDGDDNDPNSPGNEENMYPTENWVKFALDLPVNKTRRPGEWHYFTAGVVLLGDILNKKVPGGLERYADQKLFQPLGITHYQWEYTPQGVVNTAGGIQMNALDFAKYGQLYQNNGMWQGKQIIPAAWVRKTFTRHTSIPGRNDEYYGYLFWNKTFKVDGKGYEAFYCVGNGGNYIFIFKEVPLVVVVTATAYGAYYAHPQVAKMMEEYILPAVVH